MLIGLTGGIACGKSTVARLIRESGIPVLDVDQVSRIVVQPGTPALAEIVARWSDALLPDGTLNRKLMGSRITTNPADKIALEDIIRPRMRAYIDNWVMEKAGCPNLVIEDATMVETGVYKDYDKVIVVTVSPEVQQQRLSTREGYDAATVKKWIGMQVPLAEKEQVADYLIRNEGTEAELEKQIKEVLNAINE